tara:strand:+ start:699 stop:1010 length:312 start_codon:yes stop_codon:yes gene_type:complete
MSSKSDNSANWFVYLIRTSSNALYCGITTDVERRFAEHASGRGAKALKGKGPLKLVWQSDDMSSRSVASKVEYRIKRLTKAKKELLVRGEVPLINVIDVTQVE